MKKAITFLLTLILIFTLTACSGTATAVSGIQSTNTVTKSSVTVPTTAVKTNAVSATNAPTANTATHEDPADYIWEASSEVSIQLGGSSITASNAGLKIDGSKATITSAGTYRITGSLTDGQIIVNTQDKGVVRLILNGVDIHNSTSAPIYVMDAKKTVIVLADQTKNTVTDGAAYQFDTPDVNEPNAAIFSKSDLTIYGSGSLTVDGNFNDGITSKDGLIIASGTIVVNAADDAVRGKDYVVVKDGNITLKAKGDGLKSDDEVDAAKGYISIEKGTFNITSGGDAIYGQTSVTIQDGKFTLTTGGGSAAKIDANTSAKGIKAVGKLVIDGGIFTINSADDSLHTNGSLVVNGGTLSMATGDDGMHADATLEVNGGDIRITKSYEGIESAIITLNGGEIHVVSSDDGINGAGGSGESAPNPGMRPGQTTSASSAKYFLYINGGYIVVDSGGDGVDVNGAIEMTNGVVIVNGPIQQMNGALDYDVTFKMTGGFVVAAGSSGMAQAPSANSTQSAALIYLQSSQPAGTLIHIQNSSGEDILTFSPTKQYQSVAISSPKLVKGATYTIFTGGISTGTVKDGLYQAVKYSGGTQFSSFTISSVVTTVGTGGMGGGRSRP